MIRGIMRSAASTESPTHGFYLSVLLMTLHRSTIINNSPSLALDRQYRYACGAQYDWSKDLTIGFAYKFLDLGEGKLEKSGTLAGDLAGKFDPCYIHVVTLNMSWKF